MIVFGLFAYGTGALAAVLCLALFVQWARAKAYQLAEHLSSASKDDVAKPTARHQDPMAFSARLREQGWEPHDGNGAFVMPVTTVSSVPPAN